MDAQARRRAAARSDFARDHHSLVWAFQAADYLPLCGHRRQSSSKKFNKTVMWTVALFWPFAPDFASATKRLPSGAKSKLQRLRFTGRKMGTGDQSRGFSAENESFVTEYGTTMIRLLWSR